MFVLVEIELVGFDGNMKTDFAYELHSVRLLRNSGSIEL